MAAKKKPRAPKPKVTPPIPAESEATPDDESIKLTCRNALNAFHLGNQRDALTMINEAYQKSALVQRTKANILFQAFFQLEDRSLQDFSLKSAVGAAERAAFGSPESIEFAQFFSYLLYITSDDDQGYVAVVKECWRAQSIENPIDPAEESVQDEDKTGDSSREERLKKVRDKLGSLIQQSTKVITVKPSIDTKIEWMLGSMGIDHDQVAAAMRLRQQKSGPWVERFGKRNLMYLECSVERIDQVWKRWNASSDEEKQAFLHVRSSSLKSHFAWPRIVLPERILSRAIAFFNKNKTMESWVCYQCHREFVNHGSMMHHFTQNHLEPFSHSLFKVLPQDVGHSDSDWFEMVMNGDQLKPPPEDNSTDNSDSVSLFLDNGLLGKVILSRSKAIGDDDLIYWLFHGPTTASYKDAFETWEKETEHRRQQGKVVTLSLRKKFKELESRCVRKIEYMGHMDELEHLQKKCDEELNTRQQVSNYVPQSFESLLEQQQKELILQKKDDSLPEKLLVAMFLHLEKKSQGNKGGMHIRDQLISEAMLGERREYDEEIAKIDADIVKILAALREMELKLGTLSALDYRPIIFPLMKIYIRAQLEILVGQDDNRGGGGTNQSAQKGK